MAIHGEAGGPQPLDTLATVNPHIKGKVPFPSEFLRKLLSYTGPTLGWVTETECHLHAITRL